MIAVLDHTEEIGQNVRTFWFKPERQTRYDAGQFTELYVPHNNPDDRGERRWFTLSSSPHDPLLEITTRWPDTHPSTFKQALFALPVGSRVLLADPMGDFVLPKDVSIPLIFVAGGMGVTPLHSMIKHLAHKREVRDITLLHTVRNKSQLMWSDLFEAHDMDFIPLVNEPSNSTDELLPIRSGERRLAAEHILRILNRKPDALLYLSGPEKLTKDFLQNLLDNGVKRQRVVTDFFPGYNQL